MSVLMIIRFTRSVSSLETRSSPKLSSISWVRKAAILIRRTRRTRRKTMTTMTRTRSTSKNLVSSVRSIKPWHDAKICVCEKCLPMPGRISILSSARSRVAETAWLPHFCRADMIPRTLAGDYCRDFLLRKYRGRCVTRYAGCVCSVHVQEEACALGGRNNQPSVFLAGRDSRV